MIKLGIVMILLSVVLFVGAVADPQVILPLGFLYCPAGQTLTSSTQSYNPRPGENDTTDSFYCVTSDGQQSEVSGQVTLSMTGVFLVLLFIGVGLTAVGGNRRKQQTEAGWRQPMTNTTSSPTLNTYGSASPTEFSAGNVSYRAMRDDFQNGVIRFGGQEVSIADLKSGAYQHQATSDSKRTLADTLKQLTDAHTQGLINDDEYGRLRQEALDKLV